MIFLFYLKVIALSFLIQLIAIPLNPNMNEHFLGFGSVVLSAILLYQPKTK